MASKDFYWKNREKLLAKAKEYRKKNKRKIRKYNREYYKENLRNRATNYEDSIKEWRLNNPEKVKAQRKLKYEVFMGRIIRPEKCSKCSIKGKIHAHHPDYSKPLDVEWLCASCHKIKHNIAT